jgi:dephospho-CoA kinase
MTEKGTPRFKLGITGGIGSGKTSVCRVFEVLKVPVFSADRVAHEIMDNDARIIKGINSIAGVDLYVKGNLDRMTLASLIFNDKNLLSEVNALVHPSVFEHFREWVSAQTAQYVIMEAAILFESGASEYVDKIATIVAPEEQRINRIIERNRLSREQIEERMRNQMDDESRIRLSDYVIKNSENEMIIPSILKIHNDILTIIKNKT